MEKIIILIGEKRVQIIVLKPGQVRRVDPRPGRSRAGTGRVEEKTGKGKTQCDPADPIKNPVTTR
jgi:hypothetical protein